MSVKEFKMLVKESSNREWLNELESSINLKACNFKDDFHGVEKLYAFLSKSQVAWEKKLEELDFPELSFSYEWFRDRKDDLIAIAIEVNEYTAEKRWKKLFFELESSEDVFMAESAETKLLFQLLKLNSAYMEGAFNYFVGRLNTLNWINNKDLIVGVFAAYELNRKKFSILVNRNEIERKDFNQWRDNFQEEFEIINEKRKSLFEELDGSKKEFQSIIKQTQLNFDNELNEWISSHKERGETHHEDSVTKISELESTYEALLMLKEPAEYWDKRAIELKKSADKWLWLSIGAGILGMTLLILLASTLSEENFYKHIKNPAISIRWSIISTIVIFLFVFLVRTFVKLAMSTYHLYRDAQERKQLTYLYLSLKKESDIPDADRHIILQSLFSRADTGLLKEDSSPTMPSGVLDKIVSSK